MKKWIFHVGVGDLTPVEGLAYTQKIKAEVRELDFFPKDRVLFIPRRGTDCLIETIEID